MEELRHQVHFTWLMVMVMMIIIIRFIFAWLMVMLMIMIIIRFIFTWLMIGGFGLIIYGGPLALMITVMAVQVKVGS